jgi:hypothetical protein
MRKATLILAAVLLAVLGCKRDGVEEMYEQTRSAAPAAIVDGQRFAVARVGTFRDDLAYNDVRGIYIIRDLRTKREFIGVSGIGISELGSHSEFAGNIAYIHEDER